MSRRGMKMDNEKSIIENIIQAIAKELKVMFPMAKIYDEDIEQGYEEPCFFISWEDDYEAKLVGNRYDFELHCRVIYFQDFQELDANNKIFKVRGKLETQFYSIEQNGIYYRIKNKHFEKQEKDLHLTFTIKCQLKIEKK